MPVVASLTGDFKEGDKVKVTAGITIYHVPKLGKEGFNMEGVEGTVKELVDTYKGEVTSITQPVLVAFELEAPNGKPAKFTVHFSADELASA